MLVRETPLNLHITQCDTVSWPEISRISDNFSLIKLWFFNLISCLFDSGFPNLVPTYLIPQSVIMFYVSTCLRVFVFYIAVSLHAILFYVSTCLCDFEFDITTTAQKMKFSIKDFFSKCDQICRKLEILMENFSFCAVHTS